MRITNQMMTNNMMSNVSKNKTKLDNLDNQYTSGDRIQRPSDDPIIAVRTLKLRTTLSELNQYLDKNIPDALSWMDVTEGALGNMNQILRDINTYCNQGSNDPLNVSNRSTIVENLTQLKEQLFKECNANYAGRYVFSGYKTNSSITYEKASQDLTYNITEDFSGEDIEQFSKVTGGYTTADYDSNNPDASVFSQAPKLVENLYRLRLSYSNLDAKDLTTDDIKYKTVDQTTGESSMKSIDELGITLRNTTSKDDTAYIPADNEIVYLNDTGELIMGSGVYEKLRLQEKGGITVDYQKTNFSEGDCKPEHFFNCTSTDKNGEVKTYTQEEQPIYYEVNFNQTMKVNTQISQYMGTDLGRDIEEILNAVNAVQDVENQMANVDKLLSNVDITTEQKKALEELKSQLSTEHVLKTKIMTNAFESGIGKSTQYQSQINVAVADLGSRYSRVTLTQDRLETQKVDYTELLSNNEDADLVDTFINLTSANTIYNASLNSISKIMGTSLIDFI